MGLRAVGWNTSLALVKSSLTVSVLVRDLKSKSIKMKTSKDFIFITGISSSLISQYASVKKGFSVFILKLKVYQILPLSLRDIKDIKSGEKHSPEHTSLFYIYYQEVYMICLSLSHF